MDVDQEEKLLLMLWWQWFYSLFQVIQVHYCFFLHFLLLWLLVKVLLGVEHRQLVLVLFISLVKVVQDII